MWNEWITRFRSNLVGGGLILMGLLLLLACSQPIENSAESAQSSATESGEAGAAGDFQDSFESGDTGQWGGESSLPADGEVAVEDGFESGGTEHWKEKEQDPGT